MSKRTARLFRLKAEITADEYETPDKTITAFERAMAAIVGPNDADGAPLLRLGPGGDFTQDIYPHDIFPSAGSPSKGGGSVSPEGKP